MMSAFYECLLVFVAWFVIGGLVWVVFYNFFKITAVVKKFISSRR